MTFFGKLTIYEYEGLANQIAELTNDFTEDYNGRVYVVSARELGCGCYVDNIFADFDYKVELATIGLCVTLAGIDEYDDAVSETNEDYASELLKYLQDMYADCENTPCNKPLKAA